MKHDVDEKSYIADRFPTFQERLSRIKKDCGFESDVQFAQYLGLSRQTIGFYLKGIRIPDASVLKQIAERCNVSADWLLGLSSERTFDGNVQTVCKYTGLTGEAVCNLCEIKNNRPVIETLNFLLEKMDTVRYIANFFSGFVLNNMSKKPYKYIPIKSGALYPYMDDVLFSKTIRALQDDQKVFKKMHSKDETFICDALNQFLQKYADIWECERFLCEVLREDYNFEYAEPDPDYVPDFNSSYEEQDPDIDGIEAERAEKYEAIYAFISKLNGAEK